MNVRIEDVVHGLRDGYGHTTHCGANFGPGVAVVRMQSDNRSYLYLARLEAGVQPHHGEVVTVPPDGVVTTSEVTCLLCIGDP